MDYRLAQTLAYGVETSEMREWKIGQTIKPTGFISLKSKSLKGGKRNLQAGSEQIISGQSPS